MQYNVDLPKIYEKLTLADFAYSRDNISAETMIINLCFDRLESQDNCFIYNFILNDSDEPSYNYFKSIMLQCVDLIHIAVNSNFSVIVNCAAGVNRSSSVIVAYAILKKEWTVDDAIDYIREQKRNKYKRKGGWSTLTNTTFVEYLKKMKNEVKI